MQERPWLTFYGDDFTGSSAVMEVLAFAGVPTVMFLGVPDAALLARFANMRAIGIAGIARSQTPAWMDRELPPLFQALHELDAPILHYKTCSTFDSSAELGSIGRASEIGLTVTDASWAPLVVGAPAIGRYQMFGTLFASFDGTVHRLDRHPVMSQHPATPMHEADLCSHLAAQTTLPTATVDWRSILAGAADAAIDAARKNGARIVALDLFDDATCSRVGELLWRHAKNKPLFALGSQGIEYALVAHWRQCGLLTTDHVTAPLAAVDRLLVVSGSCSVVTARQIDEAEHAGFAILRMDVAKAVNLHAWENETEVVAGQAIDLLAAGRDVVVCTARGTDDPASVTLANAMAGCAEPANAVHARIGDALGRLVRDARTKLGLQRAVIAGGDTSGHALMSLGATALLPHCPLAPGVPMLRAISSNPAIDGLELALKGGQMGASDIFLTARFASRK